MATIDTASPAEAGGLAAESKVRLIQNGLKRRHARERRFRIWGLMAVAVAVSMVVILFGSVLSKGLPAFWQSTLSIDVTLDPGIIDIDEIPMQAEGQSAAEYRAQLTRWQRSLTLVNWNKILEASIRAELPPGTEVETRAVNAIITSDERFKLRDMVLQDPGIIGDTVRVDVLASADVDNWLKGNIDRSLPDNQQQLSADARALADDLAERGVIEQRFNPGLFLNVDSRSSPASAGLAGAFMGSLYMMLIVIVLAVPIGVASAIYLEEFAPKNRLTDLIEVNINNLAAVPSIVFGLLGAAVFINWFRLPISAPLVGGLVLVLMTLPTIIIATRGTLRAIPPSIRQAALGIGASRTQAVFHHVLPLAYPGILTATIIGVAQALGETAPLLLIGMNAFVANVPSSPLDQATALPVQIYLWQANENYNFFLSRTNAAIIVLLGLMMILNAMAIILRQRIEKRW